MRNRDIVSTTRLFHFNLTTLFSFMVAASPQGRFKIVPLIIHLWKHTSRLNRREPSAPPGASIPARPVRAGRARIMGFERAAIWKEMEERAGRGAPSKEHPYGTGDAAEKIVDALEASSRLW